MIGRRPRSFAGSAGSRLACHAGWVCLAVLLGLAAAGPAWAETVAEAEARALHDYYQGNYERAAQELQRLLAIPVENEDLHYDLGCAYFRLGKLGPAIYHFERALALSPSDEDARYNLDTSRTLVASRVKDEIKGASDEALWVRLSTALRLQSWAAIFLGLWWATLGILFLLRFLRGAVRAGLIAVDGLLLVLMLMTALGLAAREYHDRRVHVGIVLPDQVVVREGPDVVAKVSFRLHAGLKVRLQESLNGWSRIRLPNGLEGWLPDGEVGRL
jgi:tetratricopeptide (TPR) repeat protein